MTTLSELQSEFQSFLLGRGRDGIERLTVGSERLPAGRRLAVYAEAYRLRLLEVLADDFPGLKDLVGEQAFESLGGAYIDACPSTHPSVRWFGQRLPAFLREAADYRGRPELAEMAEFEWCQGEVMDAADSPAVSVDELGALEAEAWPGMRLVFQSALRRLDLEWNVPAAWQSLQEGGAQPALARAGGPVPWLLWRQGIEVHWRSLDEEERHALDAARGGAAFGDLCEGLLTLTRDDQVPMRAAGYLKRWVVDGLISRVEA